MAKKKKRKPLSAQLRLLVDDSELSRYRIAIESDIDHSQLSRFMAGTGRLTTDSMDRIGETLKLELQVRGN